MANDYSISFLGPAGTNCDEAAHKFAKHIHAEVTYVPCGSFADVFENVERGKTEYGVVATENSIEGSVTSTLDSFAFSSSATIIGQTVLPIHHCLVMKPGTHLADITTVASHPQGLAQCRRFIALNLPGRDVITVASTAESARMAAEDPHIAGIANEYAAELFGAEVREREIGDRVGNETSFALIGRQGAQPVFDSDYYKTSLALYLRSNSKGALSMVLNEFTYADIDLAMIQSRPTKRGLGDYMFFIDAVGRENDPNMQMALNCLRLKLREVKVLGSYPVAR